MLVFSIIDNASTDSSIEGYSVVSRLGELPLKQIPVLLLAEHSWTNDLKSFFLSLLICKLGH